MTDLQLLIKRAKYFWRAELWLHLFLFCFFVFLTTIFDLDKPDTEYLTVKVVCIEVLIGFISYIIMDEDMEREAGR